MLDPVVHHDWGRPPARELRVKVRKDCGEPLHDGMHVRNLKCCCRGRKRAFGIGGDEHRIWSTALAHRRGDGIVSLDPLVDITREPRSSSSYEEAMAGRIR